MNKQVTLQLDKDNVYVAECQLDREFFIDLKDVGLIQRASSFEDLPAIINAQICVEQQDLHEKKAIIQIFTDESIPQQWNTATLKYLNRDLIGRWDNQDFIEVTFPLNMKHIAIAEDGVAITIDIPL